MRGADADAAPRLDALAARARAFRPILISRAYGAWYDQDEARAAFAEGLDPVFVPPVSAGNVPTTAALVADGEAMLRAGQIQALALSGDDRLLPLIAHSCLPDGPCLKLAETAEPATDFVRQLTRAERYRRSVA